MCPKLPPWRGSGGVTWQVSSMHNVNERNDSCPVQTLSAADSKSSSCWTSTESFLIFNGNTSSFKAIHLEESSKYSLILQVIHKTFMRRASFYCRGIKQPCRFVWLHSLLKTCSLPSKDTGRTLHPQIPLRQLKPLQKTNGVMSTKSNNLLFSVPYKQACQLASLSTSSGSGI